MAGLTRSRPVRVAVDGVDGAGKTTLADELEPRIEALGRPAIRASIDGFRRPRAERYDRGPDSAEGFYEDSFDFAGLRADLLDPLGPGGHRRYRTAAFDWRTDRTIVVAEQTAPTDAVLLFDGIFCQRPELRGCWELVVFLEVGFEETLRRMKLRDRSAATPKAELEHRFHARYAPGQRLYLDAVRPRDRADLVVDNTDPAHPRLVRG
jgi:uridine kinase